MDDCMKTHNMATELFDFFYSIENTTGLNRGGIIDHLVIEQKQVTNLIGRLVGEKQIY